MLSTYLSLLDKHDYYDKSVRTLLLRRLDLTQEQTQDFKLLKKFLFERAQRVNSGVVFSELDLDVYVKLIISQGFIIRLFLLTFVQRPMVSGSMILLKHVLRTKIILLRFKHLKRPDQ